MDCQFSALTLGSDNDESAMRKCMSAAFPSANTILCSRHLKENTDRKLDAVIGNRTDTRRLLHEALFGN